MTKQVSLFFLGGGSWVLLGTPLGQAPALPSNITLGQNTLACYITEFITVAKSFILETSVLLGRLMSGAFWCHCYKTFYGRNLRMFVIRYSVCPQQASLPNWKDLSGTNTIAYYKHLYITAVKSFITFGAGPSLIKFFTAVI